MSALGSALEGGLSVSPSALAAVVIESASEISSACTFGTA
jgi:hypothetical protein